MEESREMWSSLMKAAWTWVDGKATDPWLNLCAENLIKLLINIAGACTFQGKTKESEVVLQEALQVCPYEMQYESVSRPACGVHVIGRHLVSLLQWFSS